MKESELLGKLMPRHPDIFPIIENIRKKYRLPEVDPAASEVISLWFHQVTGEMLKNG